MNLLCCVFPCGLSTGWNQITICLAVHWLSFHQSKTFTRLAPQSQDAAQIVWAGWMSTGMNGGWNGGGQERGITFYWAQGEILVLYLLEARHFSVSRFLVQKNSQHLQIISRVPFKPQGRTPALMGGRRNRFGSIWASAEAPSAPALGACWKIQAPVGMLLKERMASQEQGSAPGRKAKLRLPGRSSHLVPGPNLYPASSSLGLYSLREIWWLSLIFLPSQCIQTMSPFKS